MAPQVPRRPQFSTHGSNHEGGKHQQCHQVDTDPQACRQRSEEQQAWVAILTPAQQQPHLHAAAEHGHGVDFALHSREPGTVAEKVAERCHSGSEVSTAPAKAGTTQQ